LRYLAQERLGRDVSDTSFIDCGGKGCIPLYMDVLNAFQVQYFVVHDQDPITEADTQSDKYTKQRRHFDLNQGIADRAAGVRVFVLDPDFERVAGTSESQCKKLGKALANMERVSELSYVVPDPFKDVCYAATS
jgi:hypothetical protein